MFLCHLQNKMFGLLGQRAAVHDGVLDPILQIDSIINLRYCHFNAVWLAGPNF